MGRLSGSQQLHLALTLRLRNQEELLGLLRDLYDPASPDYRHFLTVEEFTDRFGPTAEDYERVAEFARSNGLAVTQTAANRLVLDVTGSVANIERAFQVTMQVYQHPREPRTFYAPDVEPTLEPSLPVQGVQGLNNFEPPHPTDLKIHQLGEGSPQNVSGSGPNGYFLGSDFRAAYAPGVTLEGSGQAIGLYENGAYNLSDVQLYFTNANQTLNVPIVNVLLDGLSGECTAFCTDGEQDLDIEQAISMAPGLSALIVYEGDSDVDILNQMATDNVASQLSCSWSWWPDPSAVEPIFQEFAAQGQSFLAASGDIGAFTPPSCTTNCSGALFPAADPFVTAVGGTDLTTTGPGGTWQSETAWVDSGGGITGFPIPTYQAPLINSLNQGSTTFRNVPDVAANANFDIYTCEEAQCGYTGGTSAATPVWAGFLALANQQGNGSLIGFLNPTIYPPAQGPDYANEFHDITSGNNFNSYSPNLFSAIPGYDLVTGLGSPSGQKLLNVLGPATTGPNFALASSPSTLSLSPGGQASSTITVEPANGFTGTVSLRATALGQLSGVTVSFSPATVTASGTSTLTVSTADTALNPSIPIVVTGMGGGLTHTLYITLAVLMPELVETAVSAPPASLSAGGNFPVTDTTQNIGQAPAASSTTGYYLSATTSKTVSSLLLGRRTVPSLAINAVSNGTMNVTVPSGVWPSTAYYLLACANDSGTIVEAGTTTNCIASTATTISGAPAPPGTATTLAATSGGNAVTTVAQGSVVVLTATVTSGGAPVTTGQVNFCDATAAGCTDIHLLGTAQLMSTGTAVLKFIPGLGTHSYKAVFRGTINNAGSSSKTSALTVSGKYPTENTIVAQSGNPGNYTLMAQVAGAGSVSPTGEISFLDTSNGNAVLGAAALVPGAPTLDWTSQTPATGLSAPSVAVGDFNGDGIQDLAIPNGSNCTVTILLGNGDGTFRSAPKPTVPCGPNSVAVGDFNGDGKADLALSTLSSTAQGSVTILLGNGDGTFTLAPVSPATASYPFFIAVGDFNGDGKADLAILSSNPNYYDSPGILTILLGNGDGTFTAAASPTIRNFPTSLAVGDFNGDGKEDLAVSNTQDGALTILLGNGDGTFGAPASPLNWLCSLSVVAADFNGDGKLDLALADTIGNTILILLGNGDGTFTPTTTSLQTGDEPWAIAVGDFNGDGKADLAAVNAYSNSVTIFLGNGDGTFTPASVSPATGSNPESIVAADFNGDGNLDLAVANLESNTATILLSEPTSTATATASGISPLGSGTHMVEASYAGDTNYESSVSGTTALTATTEAAAGVSPSTLTFAALMVNSTSSPQAVTLSNSGNSALAVASVTTAGDFAQTNNCGSSVAVGGSCTIKVTFSPAKGGSLTGTLTITDNSNNTTGSTQTVTLSGTGQDFTVSAASGSSTSATVAPGSSATYSLSVGAEGGMSGTVSFNCTGAPSESTCTVSPGSAAPGNNVTVSVSTTAPSANMPRSLRPPRPDGRGPGWCFWAMWIALILLLQSRRYVRTGRRALPLALGAALMLAAALAGCGGGGGGGNSNSNPGTPAGSYTIVVTGSVGTGSSADSHTVNLTLTVS
jgi:hypothetical protein